MQCTPTRKEDSSLSSCKFKSPDNFIGEGKLRSSLDLYSPKSIVDTWRREDNFELYLELFKIRDTIILQDVALPLKGV